MASEPFPVASEQAWLPLTAAQLGVYFLHQLRPGLPVCTTAELTTLPAGIETDRLIAALHATYVENEQLRVRLRTGPTGPEQQVTDTLPTIAVVEVADRAAADDWVETALATPFDLDAGEVVRAAILCVAGEPRWWLHAAHHVVLDGYGFIRLAGRVGDHYRGAARPAPAVSVAALVAEDQARREPDALAAEQEFWAHRLAEAEGSSSLAGQTADATTPVHRAAVALPTETQEALVAAAGRYGVAWTDLATAAFGAYLGRLAPGDPDVVRLGVPFMDRFVPGRGAWLTAKTVCTAMNVLPVSVPVSNGDVAGLVAATAAELAAIRDHVTVRHEDLARDLRHRVGPGTALFGPQVNLLPFSTAVNFGIGSGTVRNVTAGPVEDMTWTIRGAVGRGQPVWLEIAGNPALYAADEVQASAGRLLAWLATFATAAGNTPVSELPLLSEAERQQVLETFNATERPDLLAVAQTLPAAFAAQAAADPEAIALIDADRTWTYAELSTAAQRLRVELQNRGLPKGAAVGVALPRDARLYVAVHGIVAAGSPYVPLDPEQPMARSAEIVADAGISVVVAGADSMAELPTGLTVIDLDQLLADDSTSVTQAPAESGPELDDPAYLIFTSGSTGRPKGVVVTHRAIANRLAWMQELYPLHPGDRVLHKTPYTFDVSVWELFWPLQVGATVVIAPPGAHRDPRALAGLITEHRVHTLHFVPSMLRAFLGDPVSVKRLQAAGSPVRQLFCSGEALPRDLVEQAADVFGTWAINLYGPTEAAVDVTGWVAAPGETEVPIGRPLPNVRCYVLDRWGGPVPVGTIGHLYLAGVQLALGYAGRPDLTEVAFVRDPFVDGERMYATGDLAYWRPDGALCYEGRADAQIKIAGQRVEPGEVETVLRTAPGVETAAVLAVSGPAGLRLAAYVILTPPSSDTWRAELSSWLSGRLPSHMVPSILQRVDTLPTTSSGKLDRRALLASGVDLDDAAIEVAVPTSWLEEQIAATMSAVLGTAIGADDDFFDAGGSSLLAVRLLGELESLAGRQLALADVFTAPTPRRMAQRFLSGPSTPADDLAPVLTLRPGDPGVTPLIALPPAGGLGWCYAGLLRHLPPSVPVYALQADVGPDADQRADLPTDPPPLSLDTLAERYLERIRPLVGEGGCHLLGWSLGGMAAHAVAELAMRTGVPVGAVIMVDAYPGEQWRQLPEPTEQDGLLALVRMGGVEHLVPEDATLDLLSVQALLSREGSALAGLSDQVREAVIGNALVGARLVRASTHRRLDRDVCLVVAGAPRPETWLDPAGWAPHVGGIVHQVVLDGAHHQLLREPMIAELGELTSKAIADWR